MLRQRVLGKRPGCGFVHSSPMQPTVRQFPSGRSERKAQTSSGPLDPLLQFDSEERSALRRGPGVVTAPAPAASPSAARAEVVVRPQLTLETPDAARSGVRKLAWPVAAVATFAGVVAAVYLVQMNAPSRSSAQQQLVPPAVAAPVATAPAVEMPAEPAPFVRARPIEEKKPVESPVKLRPPSIDTPPAAATANRAVGVVSYYGSLAIDSAPVGARVFLNGEPAGTTPLVLRDVPVGSRAVRLEADGHTSWSSTVRVVTGERARVSATLTPTSQGFRP